MKELSLKNCRLDGRYDIYELLGRGSYAEIYVARDNLASPQSPHSQVVIKALNVFMQNDLDADLERTLVENFQNEAIALDLVRHPNIISRLGHGTARDLNGIVFHYLVVEYLPGGDLARLCREKSLSFEQALFYLEQVCAGLAHAHQKGVIHRDVKPQNLLLTRDLQTVKIADFGVARLSQSSSPITRVGTNIYAPPEHSPMMAGDTGVLTVSELTPAADIYSLAKSAYVLLTGESPRFFANRPVTELPFAVRSKSWAPEILPILEKATQNNPAERYQTVDEFWQELFRVRLAVRAEEGEVKTHVGMRHNSHPQPHVAKGYTPLAPQRPQFNTSRDLKIERSQLPPLKPSVVVKIDEGAKLSRYAEPPPAETSALPSTGAANDAPVKQQIMVKRKKTFLRRLTNFMVALSLLVGILYGTHNYFSGSGGIPEFRNPFGYREGVSLRDIPLRPDSSTSRSPIGWVPANSRVRIVNETEKWYEVDVIEYGRTKDPGWAEHGWIAKKTVFGEENVKLSR